MLLQGKSGNMGEGVIMKERKPKFKKKETWKEKSEKKQKKKRKKVIEKDQEKRSSVNPHGFVRLGRQLGSSFQKETQQQKKKKGT